MRAYLSRIWTPEQLNGWPWVSEWPFNYLTNILTILKFWQFWQVLTMFYNFEIFWQFFDKFWQFVNFFTIFTIDFHNFDNFDNVDDFGHVLYIVLCTKALAPRPCDLRKGDKLSLASWNWGGPTYQQTNLLTGIGAIDARDDHSVLRNLVLKISLTIVAIFNFFLTILTDRSLGSGRQLLAEE